MDPVAIAKVGAGYASNLAARALIPPEVVRCV
jgi:hypothetical protein